MTGVVVWATGLPSAGKSTFAARLRDACAGAGVASVLLDGDAVRAALVPAPGHDGAGRAAFYETLARLAALLAAQGLAVCVAATAHRRGFRERARALAPAFVEVWVRTPAGECARRDPRGLWARARAGALPDFPAAAYEPPDAPDVVAEGGADAGALGRAADLAAALAIGARVRRRAEDPAAPPAPRTPGRRSDHSAGRGR